MLEHFIRVLTCESHKRHPFLVTKQGEGLLRPCDWDKSPSVPLRSRLRTPVVQSLDTKIFKTCIPGKINPERGGRWWRKSSRCNGTGEVVAKRGFVHCGGPFEGYYLSADQKFVVEDQPVGKPLLNYPP